MSKEKEVAPSMNWLVDGKEDPFASYVKRKREDLPLADFSDDALANYAFMEYDRDRNTELEIILGRKEGHPLIHIMTAMKERMRWLARQLAVAQGIYPGTQKLTNGELVQRAIDAPIIEVMKHMADGDPADAYPKIDLDPELFKGPIAGSYAEGIVGLADELGEDTSSGKSLPAGVIENRMAVQRQMLGDQPEETAQELLKVPQHRIPSYRGGNVVRNTMEYKTITIPFPEAPKEDDE